MIKTYLNTLFVLILLSLTSVSNAQDSNTKNTLKLNESIIQQKATINDVKWLQGNWTGVGFGNFSQEVWAKPSAHSMMGMFQMIKNDKVVFYELFHIIEKNSSLLLEIKHFNADLTGWEEKEKKVSFPLIKIEEQKVWFDGITYLRKDNKLFAWVAIKNKDGSVTEGEFKFSLSE